MPDLGALISDFLADADTSGLYTRDQLRSAARRHLAHVRRGRAQPARHGLDPRPPRPGARARTARRPACRRAGRARSSRRSGSSSRTRSGAGSSPRARWSASRPPPGATLADDGDARARPSTRVAWTVRGSSSRSSWRRSGSSLPSREPDLATVGSRVTAACTAPGVLVRLSGGDGPYPAQLFAYGGAVVAAAFLLAWACEAAQVEVAHGLVVAVRRIRRDPARVRRRGPLRADRPRASTSRPTSPARAACCWDARSRCRPPSSLVPGLRAMQPGRLELPAAAPSRTRRARCSASAWSMRGVLAGTADAARRRGADRALRRLSAPRREGRRRVAGAAGRRGRARRAAPRRAASLGRAADGLRGRS